MRKIYTVGHSTRTIEEFIELLKAHGIEKVVDVRTIPKSRHNPQFAGGALERSLTKEGIGYEQMGSLGGFRQAKKDSKNMGWRNASFRGYADYMGTPEFSEALSELELKAGKETVAIMCSEAVPWRCHRSLIADALTEHGWEVLDITSPAKATKHRPTPFLKVKNGVLTYPPEQSTEPLL